MTDEDFERLKKLCFDNGFEVEESGLIPSDSKLVEVYVKEECKVVNMEDRARNEIYKKILNRKME
jgi:hypothetical protein